jgi:hypothetical protein
MFPGVLYLMVERSCPGFSCNRIRKAMLSSDDLPANRTA